MSAGRAATSSGRPRSSPPPSSRTPVRSVRRVTDGVEIRDDADVVRTFDAAVVATHADDALGLLADPTAGASGRRSGRSVVGERDRAAHRRLGAPVVPAGAGVVELPARPLRVRRRPGARQLRHEPAAPARRAASDYVVTLNPGDRVDDDRGARAACATRTRCTPPSRSPRRRRCPRSTTAGSRSPARTTGGASTRTAACRACGPPPSLGSGVVKLAPGGGAVLYRTRSRHGRTERVRHGFSYRHVTWLVDLDAVPTLPRPLRVLGAFDARDHLGDPRRVASAPTSTRTSPTRASSSTAGACSCSRTPRSFGYTFNPLSVFWCYDRDGALACVVAEVHNTYGERHCYLLRPDAGGRAGADKEFYVSPFFAVDGRYEMTFTDPRPSSGELRVEHHARARRSQLVFRASLDGRPDTAAPSFLARRAAASARRPAGDGADPLAGDPALAAAVSPSSPGLPAPVAGRSHRHERRALAVRRTRRRGPRVPGRTSGPAPAAHAGAHRHRPGRSSTGWCPRSRCASSCPTVVARWRRRRRPAHARPQRRLLPPPRGRRPHRVRRGVHGRRLGRRRSRPRCSRRSRRACRRLVPAWMQRLRHFYVRHQPTRERNTPAGARRNIERHYDLSNELFALFLDESMTYSSARFEPGDYLRRRAAPQDRPAARRHRRRPGHARARDRHRVGRARGARRAARRHRHHAHAVAGAGRGRARTRARARASAARVDVQLRDYREVDGHLRRDRERRDDRGGRAWSTGPPTSPPSTVRSRPVAGSASRRSSSQHDRMLATRDQYTWISKYIFPGGALPSLRAIEETVRDAHRPPDRRPVTRSAPTTRGRCAAWRERFDAHAAEVDALGFDATFRRMWDFYLAYCEAGFATGYLDVAQLVLSERGTVHDRRVVRVARHPRPRSSGGWSATTSRCGIRAWDGSEVGRRPARRWWCCATGARCAACSGAPTSSVWPGPTSPATSTSRATSPTASAGSGRSREPRRDRACTSAIARPRRRGRRPRLRLGVVGLPPRPPASEARIHGRLHSRDARPCGHRPPLRPVERLLRARARRAHGVLVARTTRADGTGTCRWPTRSAPSSSWCAPSSGSRPGMRHARRRVRLGFAQHPRRAAPRRARHRRHAVAGAARLRPQARRRPRRRRPDRLPPAGLPRHRRRPLRRRRVDRDGRARRRRAVPDVRRAPCTALLRPGAPVPGAADVARRGQLPRRRAVHRGVHRARHAHAPAGRDHRPARSGRVRGARRAGAARALRAHRRRVAAPTSKPGGTRSSPWSGRRSPGCGASTSSAGRSRSRSGAWASTRSWWRSADSVPTHGELRHRRLLRRRRRSRPAAVGGAGPASRG